MDKFTVTTRPNRSKVGRKGIVDWEVVAEELIAIYNNPQGRERPSLEYRTGSREETGRSLNVARSAVPRFLRKKNNALKLHSQIAKDGQGYYLWVERI